MPTSPEKLDVGLRASLPPGLVRRLEPHRARLRPSLCYTRPQTRGLSEAFFESFPPGARLLDVGAGACRYERPVTTVDASPIEGLDIVAHVEALPLESESFDGVLLRAVLHQVRDLGAAMTEVERVLAPGGRVLIEAPFMQGYNAGPDGDYWRFTPNGLRALVESQGLEPVRSGVIGGPGSAVAWSGAEMIAMLVSGRSMKRYRFARLLATWLVQPIKFLDHFLERHPMARAASSGSWIEARKPGERTQRFTRNGAEPAQ